MKTTQHEMLRIAKVLEKMGYSIVEIYNQAGFLRIYVDGKEMTLGELVRLWRKD